MTNTYKNKNEDAYVNVVGKSVLNVNGRSGSKKRASCREFLDGSSAYVLTSVRPDCFVPRAYALGFGGISIPKKRHRVPQKWFAPPPADGHGSPPLLCVFIFLIIFVVYGGTVNRLGSTDDTCHIDGFRDDSLRYTRWLSLSDREDIRVAFKFDDTSSVGFSGDSLNVIFGYQTGMPCLDSSDLAENEEVCIDERIVLDTARSDSLGKLGGSFGYMVPNGNITRHSGQLDTTSCGGYAVIPKWLTPEWDVYIRFWFYGAEGTKKGSFVKVRADVQRRVFIGVRSR